MEEEQGSGLYAFEHRLRLVYADSAGTYRVLGLYAAQGEALLLPYLLQLFRLRERGHGGRGHLLLPDGLLPSGGAERYRSGHHKEGAFADFRNEAHHKTVVSGPHRAVLALADISSAPSRRGLHCRHKRRKLSDGPDESSFREISGRLDASAADLVGLFHLSGHFYDSASVHPLYAYPDGDAADSDAECGPEDNPRQEGFRQGSGLVLSELRRLHRRVSDECEEGEHQGCHGVSEPSDPPGQREAHRGDKRQVPALRKVYGAVSGGRGRAGSPYGPEGYARLCLCA